MDATLMALNIIALFCEDVREEKSEQSTLVGILPDNIRIPSPPADDSTATRRLMIPKLAIYVRVHLEPDDNPGTMTVKLILPNKAEMLLSTFDEGLIAKAKKDARSRDVAIAGLRSQIVMQGFRPPDLGQFYVAVDTESERHICGSLHIEIEHEERAA